MKGRFDGQRPPPPPAPVAAGPPLEDDCCGVGDDVAPGPHVIHARPIRPMQLSDGDDNVAGWAESPA
eukprot:11497740-Heterocapsa_arctica.AAC.1